MLDFLAGLEPRFFERGDEIFKELDECHEFFFVLKGKYVAGYQINNRTYYRLKFGEGTLLGAFNVMFRKRSHFIMKCSSFMNCLGCRKQNWRVLMDNYPEFEFQLKIKFYNLYEKLIRKPLMKKKEDHLKKFR